ncbi:hypothetical protein [Streptomyces silvisoli]|nr:hypothetical protein [Streptomyces silvisoli]
MESWPCRNCGETDPEKVRWTEPEFAVRTDTEGHQTMYVYAALMECATCGTRCRVILEGD